VEDDAFIAGYYPKQQHDEEHQLPFFSVSTKDSLLEDDGELPYTVTKLEPKKNRPLGDGELGG
jgi:hypothetical protein